MFSRGKTPVIALGCLLAGSQAHAVDFSVGTKACTDQETWTFSEKIGKDWQESFKNAIAQKEPVVLGLADSMAMEGASKSEEEILLAVYWKNRSLFQSKLIHVSVTGFNWIASQPVKKETIGIQTAAIECLNQLYYQYPRIHLDPNVIERIPEYSKFYRRIEWAEGNDAVLFDAAAILLKIQISENRPDAEIETTLAFLKGSGPYEKLSQGLWAAYKANYPKAVENLEAFLKTDKLPPNQDRYRDAASLSLARSYYALGKFEDSIKVLKKVKKDSNHMVRVLSELSWSFLLNHQYKEAVGTALNFQVGGFQKTFAPDAIMVMAMALNELCQYPMALRSVSYLRQFYRPSYYWLKKWHAASEQDRNKNILYKYATDYLEKGRSEVPMRVMSEWLRSPLFLAHQEEMNRLMDEKQAARKLKGDLRIEYKKMRDELVAVSKRLTDKKNEIREQLKQEKIIAQRKNVDLTEFKKKSKELVASLESDIAFVKKLKTRIENLRKAVKPIETVQKLYQKQGPEIERRLIARINADLTMRNLVMMEKLKDLAENTYLIEVEIYNGASEDVVWQNAHPEFKGYMDKVKKDSARAMAPKVYNWGAPPTNEEGFTEIWADELGNMMANVADNCSNKEKYLSVKFAPQMSSVEK